MKNSRLKAALASLSHRRSDFAVGALSGLAGGFAYLAEMEADLRAFDYNADDRILLAGLIVKDSEAAKVAGTIIHLANSVVVGIVYETLVQQRLRGSGWTRGVMFASSENLGLYALMKLERYHPAIRDGRLASYWTKTAFLQGIMRHMAFGAALGWTADRLQRR